ncbi:hypothetical protein RHGRI_023993 [Rhododendron griersonianum]|uniref:Uncharacterized protein n=1 Tax=Rhododendron griersonianum TaxID=479676 RepID=A0AAV6JAX3_9ERIC|nr:hypothetical protein RHGRI_023993 [Rhododendron griersonianum]
MAADAKLDWVESIPGRGFKSERQNLDTSEALAKGKISSKVNNKKIVVDAKIIAQYLKYGRPEGDLVNYPRAEPIDSNEILNDLYTTIPNVGVPPHRPAENKPSRRSAEILYTFMNDAEYKADWAKFIFEQTPGVITPAVVVKSKSQSKAAAVGTSAGPSSSAPPEPSLWSVPDPKASKESIWRKMCCQNIAIWNCIQKEKNERKKLSREVGELKDELRWHTQYIESTSDEKYEAPPRVEEANSEEEILFGPGAAPGGQ